MVAAPASDLILGLMVGQWQSCFQGWWGLPLGMTIRVWVPDPTGIDMGIIFYPWVAPVSDSDRDGYFFHP
jgi:hypothetical protein